MRLVKGFLPLVGLLSALCATPAHATLQLTGSVYDPGSRSGGISVQSLNFSQRGSAGRFRIEAFDTVTFARSTFYSFCIDVTTALSLSTFSVSNSIPGFTDPDKLAQLAAILFNSDAALGAAQTQDEKDAVGAALQLAVWEILYEADLSSYSIANGNFSVFGDFETDIGLANRYLANVETGAWTGNAASLRALVSDTGTSQNQVFQTAPVPEPSTWALMILGFGAIGSALRRRNARAGLSLA